MAKRKKEKRSTACDEAKTQALPRVVPATDPDEFTNPTCRRPGSDADLAFTRLMFKRQVHHEHYLACRKPSHPEDTRAKQRSWCDEVSMGGVWADVDVVDTPAISELPLPLSSDVLPHVTIDRPEPAPCSTLFVSNIPQGITLPEVRKLFGDVGRLTEVRVIPGATFMAATVTFKEFADAKWFRENVYGEWPSRGAYGALQVQYADPVAQEERSWRYREWNHRMGISSPDVELYVRSDIMEQNQLCASDVEAGRLRREEMVMKQNRLFLKELFADDNCREPARGSKNQKKGYEE